MEEYRKDVLQHTLKVYDKKWEEQNNGTRLIFRLRDWKKDLKRKKAKESKKLNMASGDGHIAPIFVPKTPGGVLLKMFRKVAEKEEKDGITFKIVKVE